MQLTTFFIAIGLIAATQAAALPAAEPAELEVRAASAPFKLRRFTPLEGFNPNVPTSWSNNQYVNVATANKILNYDGVSEAQASTCVFDAAKNTIEIGGLQPRNQQSYGITRTPVLFGGVGEPVKVTIGPGPLYEVKFQTVRDGNPVNGWTAFEQVGQKIYLGKAADVSAPIRLRAWGYTEST